MSWPLPCPPRLPARDRRPVFAVSSLLWLADKMWEAGAWEPQVNNPGHYWPDIPPSLGVPLLRRGQPPPPSRAGSQALASEGSLPEGGLCSCRGGAGAVLSPTSTCTAWGPPCPPPHLRTVGTDGRWLSVTGGFAEEAASSVPWRMCPASQPHVAVRCLVLTTGVPGRGLRSSGRGCPVGAGPGGQVSAGKLPSSSHVASSRGPCAGGPRLCGQFTAPLVSTHRRPAALARPPPWLGHGEGPRQCPGPWSAPRQTLWGSGRGGPWAAGPGTVGPGPEAGEAVWDLPVPGGQLGLGPKEIGVVPSQNRLSHAVLPGWAGPRWAWDPCLQPPPQARQVAKGRCGSQFPETLGEAPPDGRPGWLHRSD